MGGCISSDFDNSTNQKPCATVISVSGELRRYPLPVTVSQVIQFETSSPDSVFLCNSDRLYFDDYVPRLDAAEALEPDQIYFVMPASRLQNRLAASDMAALAVKASVAFNDFNPRRSRKSRISPVLVAEEDPQSIHQIKINGNSYVQVKSGRKSSLGGVPRSGSVRKMHMRRAKLAVRSFRLRLSTINEGSVLLN
ncbi:hypothetical protein SASPL_131476 [Salvia splendens]|uniref:Uncharacterized protein n=1 Tax=Salvia splendens TaxID=180675 RepID=A0A8X8ZL08_SALSN|nr:uncharacterized protein LOC121754688 [Salvia splendens]KAG6408463.1 hypothetical protein SASPL_131476 [Salvia splendens]